MRRAFHLGAQVGLEGDMLVGQRGSEDIFHNLDNDDSPILSTLGKIVTVEQEDARNGVHETYWIFSVDEQSNLLSVCANIFPFFFNTEYIYSVT